MKRNAMKAIEYGALHPGQNVFMKGGGTPKRKKTRSLIAILLVAFISLCKTVEATSTTPTLVRDGQSKLDARATSMVMDISQSDTAGNTISTTIGTDAKPGYWTQ